MTTPRCDYHNRTDFRAFDVMVSAISNATRQETEAAYKTAKEMAADQRKPAADRIIWKDIAKMLNRQRRAF